jgi:sugar fermentation stimulation protein A
MTTRVRKGRFYSGVRKARLLSRPSRSVAVCRMGSRTVRARLPDTGEWGGMLSRGAELRLCPVAPRKGKSEWRVVAVGGEDGPVVIDAEVTGRVVEHLLVHGYLRFNHPVGEVERDTNIGRERFDLVARGRGRQTVVAVGTCARSSGEMAMCGNVPAQRGARHIERLARVVSRTRHAALVMLVHARDARHFLPDYHTDPACARALYQSRDALEIVPLALRWKGDLTLATVSRLHVPWHIYEREAGNRGAYMLLLHLSRARTVTIGSLGRIRCAKGYYVYVGSALRNLTQRIARHRRGTGKRHWHIDYLRRQCRFCAAFPIATPDDIECELAGALGSIAQGVIPGFGCSDCGCRSHLFHFSVDPLSRGDFRGILNHFRMERPLRAEP